MGLNNTKTGGQYVHFKDGRFSTSKDSETTYTELEGKITGFKLVEDTYKDQVIPKLNISMTDEEDNYILSLGFNTSYTSKLINFLRSADLDESLTLVGINKPGEDGKEKPGILVKQGSGFMKGFYSREQLPQMKQVKINKELKWDKSELTDFMENIVRNELAPAVSNSEPSVVRNVDKIKDDSDSLPF